jgi:3-hydroxymyristoyl/3-hydroxydecanoyl-(acyl carrier protein) dehydratase
MVDRVDLLVLDGGELGLGLIEGSIDVDPAAWFFEAHFLEDPVWPGSLGLQAVLQLLELFALERFGLNDGVGVEFRTAARRRPHAWTYRGQITPACERVHVQASITEVDEFARRILGHAFVSVDGRVIYELRDFGVELVQP